MDFNDFNKTTGAGGALLARQAWDKAVELIKVALPDHVDVIDAALAPIPPEPETVEISANDSGAAAEGQG